jgi:hypothetical protein
MTILQGTFGNPSFKKRKDHERVLVSNSLSTEETVFKESCCMAPPENVKRLLSKTQNLHGMCEHLYICVLYFQITIALEDEEPKLI